MQHERTHHRVALLAHDYIGRLVHWQPLIGSWFSLGRWIADRILMKRHTKTAYAFAATLAIKV